MVKYQQIPVEVAGSLAIAPSQLRKWIRQYKAEVSGVTLHNPALTLGQREIELLRT